MLRVKKLFCILLIAFIFSTTSFSVFANEPEYNDKQRFVDEVLSMNEVNNNTNIVDSNNVHTVLLKYTANDMEGALQIINNFPSSYPYNAVLTQNTQLSYETLENYLNLNNVYIYSCETYPNHNTYSTGSTDVYMNRVIITYNANNNTWVVTGGGYWTSTSHLNDAPTPSVMFGAKDVGGLDAVGVSLCNTSGTVPALVSSSGYVHVGHGKNITLTNPYSIDSSKGVVFQYQDQVYVSDDLKETCYMGYGFSAQGIYNSSFSQYHGHARTYYAHTWNTCEINSIGVGKFSFSASWSYPAYGWEVSNNSDTVF